MKPALPNFLPVKGKFIPLEAPVLAPIITDSDLDRLHEQAGPLDVLRPDDENVPAWAIKDKGPPEFDLYEPTYRQSNKKTHNL